MENPVSDVVQCATGLQMRYGCVKEYTTTRRTGSNWQSHVVCAKTPPLWGYWHSAFMYIRYVVKEILCDTDY